MLDSPKDEEKMAVNVQLDYKFGLKPLRKNEIELLLDDKELTLKLNADDNIYILKVKIMLSDGGN